MLTFKKLITSSNALRICTIEFVTSKADNHLVLTNDFNPPP